MIQTMSKPVLLVEDSDDDTLLFKRALKKVKPDSILRCVTTVDDAICYLLGQGQFVDRREFPFPSVLFVDLKLPGRDGFQLLDWMNKHPDMRPITVIVLTGAGRTLDAANAYNMGAKSFLSKPIRPEDFENLIKAHPDVWR